MAAKVDLLFGSPKLRAALGQGAVQKVKKNYDILASASQFLKIIE
ncbi:MAG: hypothetical protein WCA07_04185 [Gloeobacterales cyanobacterium]